MPPAAACHTRSMGLGGLGEDTAAVVAALRAVAGVTDAEILPDTRGGPGTLRLQLAPGADEVVVGTRVSKLLREGFGLGVDADRVQIYEETPPSPLESVPDAESERDAGPAGGLSDDHEAEPALDERGARLLIQRMQLVSAREGVTSEVTLELDGRAHTGSAGAAATPSSVHRSVALATLRAVEEAVFGRLRFELEHLETTALGADRAVLVEISMITRHGSERLTGVSAVREDARQAVIRATLNALNRRIETYLVSA
jgi:hypothetical protein